jgi:hypothetical protein
MKPITLFYSRLMPWVVGCPEPIAAQALVDAAIRFCEETSVVTYTCQPQDAVADEGLYRLAVPALQSIVVTQKVWYGTTLLTPVPSTDVSNVLAAVGAVGDTEVATGEPSCFFESSPGVIKVYPVPATLATNMISAKVATRPSRSATSLDDVLYEDWADAIVAGARARLHAMPNQFFSNDAKAAQATQEFGYYLNRARGVASRGRIQTSRSVKLRGF